MSVDGSDFVSIGLEHLVGTEGVDQLSGQEIADELTKVIQEGLVTVKKFDVSSYYTSDGTTATITDAVLGITRDRGEDNADYLAVPVGAIIDAAVTAGDIVPSGSDNEMLNPEELAYALNKYFAGSIPRPHTQMCSSST